MLSADIAAFCLLDACSGAQPQRHRLLRMLESIGTLAIQQFIRSLDEESGSLALCQFDLRLKSSRETTNYGANSWQCKVATSLESRFAFT
jgi:hypothetical protein